MTSAGLFGGSPDNANKAAESALQQVKDAHLTY